MALVVFLRGVNVGGHRIFRPSALAKELAELDVVNIGAAGTFVVRKPGSRKQLRAALAQKLPFETAIILCAGSDLLRLAQDNPFDPGSPPQDVTRFVSIRDKKVEPPSLPISLPSEADWLVRVIAVRGQFVCGEYRRHMKTIGSLNQMDRLLGGQATTRNWNTILRIARELKAAG